MDIPSLNCRLLVIVLDEYGCLEQCMFPGLKVELNLDLKMKSGLIHLLAVILCLCIV